MITIPLINKVLKVNTVNAMKNKELLAIAKEVKQIQSNPKWIAYLKKIKSEMGDSPNSEQPGEGRDQNL